MNQAAAKGVIINYDALADLLESIQHFINPLNLYTQIDLTPPLVDIVAKIMVELIFTLALVTEKIKRLRSSRSILADVVPGSAQHSQIYAFRGQGH